MAKRLLPRSALDIGRLGRAAPAGRAVPELVPSTAAHRPSRTRYQSRSMTSSTPMRSAEGSPSGGSSGAKVPAPTSTSTPTPTPTKEKPPIRLILFDAFDTLVTPSKPPHVQYAEQARLLLTAHLSTLLHSSPASASASVSASDSTTPAPLPAALAEALDSQLADAAIQASFRAAFKQTWAEWPLYGTQSHAPSKAELRVWMPSPSPDPPSYSSPSSTCDSASESASDPPSGTWRETTGPDAWWALVIGRTFHGALSAVEQVLVSLELEPARASSSTARGEGEQQAAAAGDWALVSADFSSPDSQPPPHAPDAEPGPGAERRAPFLQTTLIPHLLRHFSSSAAYSLFPDTLPALALLRGGGSSSSSSSSVPVGVGVASNSDDRVLSAMRALGLGEYLNLELGPASGPEGSCQAEKHDGQGRGPPPTLSYDVGAEKPSRAFFARALARANRHLFAQTQSGEPASGTGSDSGIGAQAHGQGHEHEHEHEQGRGQGEIKPAEVLFVGDHLLEDFRGAREAGMQALWLRRSACAHAHEQDAGARAAHDRRAAAHVDDPQGREKEERRNARADDDNDDDNSHVGPHNEGAERVLRAHGLSEEEQRHTVRSLLGVVEWLRRREGR